MSNKYISDLRKTISRLNDELHDLIKERSYNSRFSYTIQEKEGGSIIKPRISVMDYTNDIRDITDKIIELKEKLRFANESTLCENGISIINNVERLKRLTAEYGFFSNLKVDSSVSRSSGYNSEIEYTEANYNINEVIAAKHNLKDEIEYLQGVIDRANLTTIVEF